jgi:hypothetical protein
MGPAFGLREMSQLLLFIVIVLLSYLIKFSCVGLPKGCCTGATPVAESAATSTCR